VLSARFSWEAARDTNASTVSFLFNIKIFNERKLGVTQIKIEAFQMLKGGFGEDLAPSLAHRELREVSLDQISSTWHAALVLRTDSPSDSMHPHSVLNWVCEQALERAKRDPKSG
jgi:hypothetical protein